jgi:hypothetical protein
LYRINEISPSPVFDLLENDLQLRLRLRTVIGLPVLEDRIVKILPAYIDAFHRDAKEWGEFPIHYVITYSESTKPLSDMLLLTIDSTTLKSYEQKNQRAKHNIKMDFIAQVDAPQIEEPRYITAKPLTLYTGGANKLNNLMLKGGSVSNNDIVKGEIKENMSAQSIWHEVFINERKVYVEVDANKDNYIDSAYYIAQDPEKARWFHVKPNAKYNFIPLDYILDILNPGDVVTRAFIEAGHKP